MFVASIVTDWFGVFSIPVSFPKMLLNWAVTVEASGAAGLIPTVTPRAFPVIVFPTRVTVGLFPVVFQGAEVAAIAVPSSLLREGDATLLERVATIISPYCLVGWDTGGVPWDPAA